MTARDVRRREVDAVAWRDRRRRPPRLVLARERERAEVAAGERAGAELGGGGERVAGAERVRERVDLALARAARARAREPVRVVGDEAEVGVVEARVDDVGDVRRVAVDLRRAEELGRGRVLVVDREREVLGR